MISNESARYLWDAKTAADDIFQFVADRGLDDCLGDKMLRSAVERQFTIIGEALSGLRRINPDLAAAIADLQRIVAFRNLLVHDYGDYRRRSRLEDDREQPPGAAGGDRAASEGCA